MTLTVLAAADRQAAPWKNGGGVTREIAVYPPGADLETFEWRASTALVAADGPFSFFGGVERTLAVLEGDGLELRIDGASPVRLGPDHDPITFPGDVAAAASLVGGPVTDLNIMTRRGAWSARLQRRTLGAAAQLAAKTDACLILLLDACEVAAARSARQLAPGDALLLAHGDRIDLAPRHAAARILVVELLRSRRAAPPLAEQAEQ
ncbi:HutD family protein [Phenylobacterium hankyongense]|uniref:HutD family protein n=1 Tax=Phenylobacterium hankyongense TaxID=1813876 RepID=A0A328ATP1_9CAUL|nr:HutD family protein [Phenylobacterium hankyongense]RAK58463.1 HutD family protein [Phenylobacterium hankyongense]